MMEPGEKLEALRKWNAAIIATRTAAGDAKIHALEFPPQQPGDDLGADGHPGLKTNQRMAEQLTAELKRTLGW